MWLSMLGGFCTTPRLASVLSFGSARRGGTSNRAFSIPPPSVGNVLSVLINSPRQFFIKNTQLFPRNTEDACHELIKPSSRGKIIVKTDGSRTLSSDYRSGGGGGREDCQYRRKEWCNLAKAGRARRRSMCLIQSTWLQKRCDQSRVREPPFSVTRLQKQREGGFIYRARGGKLPVLDGLRQAGA